LSGVIINIATNERNFYISSPLKSVGWGELVITFFVGAAVGLIKGADIVEVWLVGKAVGYC
jgi:hypothetical protein